MIFGDMSHRTEKNKYDRNDDKSASFRQMEK
jgi:hypothetical protein